MLHLQLKEGFLKMKNIATFAALIVEGSV